MNLYPYANQMILQPGILVIQVVSHVHGQIFVVIEYLQREGGAVGVD